MPIGKFALGGIAVMAITGFASLTPVYAHSQPSSPQEMQQTDALNAQAITNARGVMPDGSPASGTGNNGTGATSNNNFSGSTSNGTNGDGTPAGSDNGTTPPSSTSPNSPTTP